MANSFTRATRAALGAALVGLAVVWAVSAPALADGDDPAGDVQWGITPAGAEGPDGRRSVENTMDPGDTIEDFLAVLNEGTDSVEFQLTAADGFYSSTGRFDTLPADRESVDSGTWIALPETVAVAPRETVIVPFAVTVPDRAEPGDHVAGITASIVSVRSSEDGTAVGVESRVGFRVTTRVTGEVAPAADLAGVSGSYLTSWNPLRPGSVTVTFDVVNEGNVIITAEGAVEIGGQVTTFPAEGEIPAELLPGDTRRISVSVAQVLPLVLVPTSISLAPVVMQMNGDRSAMSPIGAEVVVWAIPWPQLLVLVGIALVVLALASGRRRSRLRLAALIEDAKEQGRQESAAPGDRAPLITT